MKEYDYIIVLKRPDYKLVDTITQIILFLTLVALASAIAASGIYWEKNVITRMALFTAITSWWIYCRIRLNKGHIPYYRIALILSTLAWYIQPGGRYIFLIYLLAAMLEKQAKFPQEIAFDDEGILINSFPKKQYAWSAIANVVLKDGILTVDFRNNKLIQKEIETPVTINLETEFTEFCRNRLVNNLQQA